MVRNIHSQAGLAAISRWNLERALHAPEDVRGYFEARCDLTVCVHRMSPRAGNILTALARAHGRTPAFGRLTERLSR